MRSGGGATQRIVESRDNFKIGTSTATIGIRGTAFNANHCTAGGPGCADLPPEVYVCVTDGSVDVTNEEGRSVVRAGQYNIIARNQAPRQTAKPGLAFTPPRAFSAPGASGPPAQDCVIR